MFCLQVEMYIDDEPSSPCRGRCCPLSPPSMLHLGIPHPLPATLPRPSLPFLLYSRDTYLLYLHLLFLPYQFTHNVQAWKLQDRCHFPLLYSSDNLSCGGGWVHCSPHGVRPLFACAPLAPFSLCTSGLTLNEAGRNFYISSLLLHNSLAQATWRRLCLWHLRWSSNPPTPLWLTCSASSSTWPASPCTWWGKLPQWRREAMWRGRQQNQVKY